MLSIITWPVAMLGCFGIFVVSTFVFLTIVYFKEYTREEKAIKEFTKYREQQAQLEKELIYLVQPPPPKKKKEKVVAEVKSDKNKKDMN